MVSPEKIDTQEAQTLATGLPNVTIRDINLTDLNSLQALFDKNRDFFKDGGIYTNDLFATIHEEIASGVNGGNHRMGVWDGNSLVGYVGTVPVGNPSTSQTIEISAAVDKDHAGQGIITAAANAVIDAENDKGNMVIAEVEPRNKKSMQLLGKLGFEKTRFDEAEGRYIYTHKILSNEEMMRRLGM